jgi:RNA polymerase sigma-70 factor (ECF subfamily)
MIVVDPALLTAARNGDRDAVGALLGQLHDPLHAVCRRMLGDATDAQDATQEALIAVVRGLPRFDGRASVATWAYRIAVNACLDEMRRRRRRPLVGLDHDAGDGAWGSDGDGSGSRAATVDATTTVEHRIDIDRALGELPPEFRAAVVLRDLADLDYAEIAEILGIPPGTVRSRIARGRAALADRFREPGNQDTPAGRQTGRTRAPQGAPAPPR